MILTSLRGTIVKTIICTDSLKHVEKDSTLFVFEMARLKLDSIIFTSTTCTHMGSIFTAILTIQLKFKIVSKLSAIKLWLAGSNSFYKTLKPNLFMPLLFIYKSLSFLLWNTHYHFCQSLLDIFYLFLCVHDVIIVKIDSFSSTLRWRDMTTVFELWSICLFFFSCCLIIFSHLVFLIQYFSFLQTS